MGLYGESVVQRDERTHSSLHTQIYRGSGPTACTDRDAWPVLPFTPKSVIFVLYFGKANVILSPVRISPATAKFKPPPMPTDLPQIQFPGSPTSDQRPNPVTVALPLGGQPRSVSAPMAASTSSGSSSSLASVPVGPSASGSTFSGSSSIPSLGSEASTTASSGALSSMPSDEILGLSANVLALAHQYANGGSSNNAKGIVPSGSAHDSQDNSVAPRYIISEESWKHHAQARAILGNLIGPNGEQLTSTDPYNTTVFVGGLSPLISEETLRTFFTPFGEIHYVRVSLLRYWWDANIAVFVQVKVPVGKHCGFVQFVRKADAERAIDKMQGFPIGGSRIRLSWGRSQCASSCIVTRPTD